MTARVEQLADQVKALPNSEREEFFLWLAEYVVEQADDWDEQVSQDSRPGGRLEGLLSRVRRDIAAGRTKPLDEVLDDA